MWLRISLFAKKEVGWKSVKKYKEHRIRVVARKILRGTFRDIFLFNFIAKRSKLIFYEVLIILGSERT